METPMRHGARLYHALDEHWVQCDLCAHACRIAPGRAGRCGVRLNQDGTLYTVAYGTVVAAHVDPIEKKPLYHFLPGSTSFSVAAAGCNFHCRYCQNWEISQVKPDGNGVLPGRELAPERAVSLARTYGCGSIAYTYTEPTVFFEYAQDTARLASKEDLRNVFVTNGYMMPAALDEIGPELHAANVDLKSFRDEFYRRVCEARLQPVLDAIHHMKAHGVWVEITTLVIPGENDSSAELSDIAGFIAEVDPAIPWHLSRFHPTYQFSDHAVTPLDSLRRAREIGREQGLQYVYLGNVAEDIDTRCPQCDTVVIRRTGMGPGRSVLEHGRCPHCGTAIPGLWKE